MAKPTGSFLRMKLHRRSIMWRVHSKSGSFLKSLRQTKFTKYVRPTLTCLYVYMGRRNNGRYQINREKRKPDLLNEGIFTNGKLSGVASTKQSPQSTVLPPHFLQLHCLLVFPVHGKMFLFYRVKLHEMIWNSPVVFIIKRNCFLSGCSLSV